MSHSLCLKILIAFIVVSSFNAYQVSQQFKRPDIMSFISQEKNPSQTFRTSHRPQITQRTKKHYVVGCSDPEENDNYSPRLFKQRKVSTYGQQNDLHQHRSPKQIRNIIGNRKTEAGRVQFRPSSVNPANEILRRMELLMKQRNDHIIGKIGRVRQQSIRLNNRQANILNAANQVIDMPQRQFRIASVGSSGQSMSNQMRISNQVDNTNTEPVRLPEGARPAEELRAQAIEQHN